MISCNSCRLIPDLLGVWLTVLSSWFSVSPLPLNTSAWVLAPAATHFPSLKLHTLSYTLAVLWEWRRRLWKTPRKDSNHCSCLLSLTENVNLENSLLLTLILLCMKYELLINEYQSVPAPSYTPYGTLKKKTKKNFLKQSYKEIYELIAQPLIKVVFSFIIL